MTYLRLLTRSGEPCSKCGSYPAVRIYSGGGHKTKYCSFCVGLILSRYSFFEVPEPTKEELKAREWWDINLEVIMAREERKVEPPEEKPEEKKEKPRPLKDYADYQKDEFKRNLRWNRVKRIAK